ncbi:hypothetical protein BD289DRAFT_480336 [Coniella lustricola]|uniref:LPXTG-domain-containing protein n=1 Tax=Coniella lustricola TaxID=2025994 RepID=A0A2T3AGC5_9PEZI|nr:hypothetical protein BD289DRAFT_480336 [Coniella lustricola]
MSSSMAASPLSFGPRPRSSLGLVLLILALGDALQTTPGSSCSSLCGDTSTSASDIVCSDFAYYSSATGSSFKDCIECLQTSNTTSDSQNDVSWFLYNLRYASAVCIFDFPNKNSSNSTSSKSTSLSCDLEYACAPLQGALEYGNLDPSNETEYGYCSADDSAFYGTSIDTCVSCLQSSPSTYTANFLLALEAGCQQEPQAGTILSITGSLFSTTAINITMASNATSSASSSSDRPVLSLTDIIAIVCSLGGLFLLATGLFGLYIARQRRYAREDALIHASTYTPRQQHFYGGGGPGSPLSGQTYAMPRYTVDHKSELVAADPFDMSPEPSDLPHKNDFQSNAEYYDRLEHRLRSQPLQANPVSFNRVAPSVTSSATSEADTSTSVPGDALPAHPAYIQRSAAPGHLGGRASRNVSRNPSIRSAVQTQPHARVSSSSEQRQEDKFRWIPGKAEAYGMQAYPTTQSQADKASGSVSNRNIQRELSTPEQAHISPSHHAMYPSPALSAHTHMSSSASSPPIHQGMTPPERTATPSRSSLILAAVPKIRIPGKKLSTRFGVDRDTSARPSSRAMGISRPLAFPDSRFSARPSNDRIVEQTVVNFNDLHTEVPIGSGKSLLYG